MSKLPDFSSADKLFFGADPYLDAWLLHFMTENNIEHLVDPINASSEQIRFIVHLEDDQAFLPCSDWMIQNLLDKELTTELLAEYIEFWRNHALLVNTYVTDRYIRKKIIALSRHKLNNALASPFLIPSRFAKHLSTIFLTQSGFEDPLRDKKKEQNKRANEFVHKKDLYGLLNTCPEDNLVCTQINDLRWSLDLLELRRLFILSMLKETWDDDDYVPDWDAIQGKCRDLLPDLDPILTKVLGPNQEKVKKILYLPDESGGIIFDIMVIRTLMRRGHQVTMALKEGFYYESPTFWDIEHDPVLEKVLEGAHLYQTSNASKNSLLHAQRENQFVVISDGSRERFNPYRTNVTFSRAWKESDLVIAKGEGNYRRVILTSHQFTRDVLCLYRDKGGMLKFGYKDKSPQAVQFTEQELLGMSDKIIKEMRQAKDKGYKVMFYSAIIGSIPGQTQVAIKVLNTFVEYLRDRLEKTMIINPAEHFKHGLDGDDLMFMWEKVQRSGVIDVWRFQNVADIEKSFELMGEKVPPIWNGKDSTFSTGCTKEMRIALEVQQTQRELQIIGPSREKFFRRREYGVGKFFDATIDPDHSAKRL